MISRTIILDVRRTRRLWVAAFAALLSFQHGQVASAQEASGLAAAAAIQDAFVKAIELAEPSVVSIARDSAQSRPSNDAQALEVFQMRRGRGGFRPQEAQLSISDPEFVPNDFGAGIILREDGLILTNYHVVRGGGIEGKITPGEQTLYVRLHDRRGFPARIRAADPRSDLAVIKIDAKDLRPMKFGNAAGIKKGQLVIAMGNPYAIARDGSASATWGMISNVSRRSVSESKDFDSQEETNRKQTLHHLGTLLQLDMRLNLGTSGGPLLNLRGELIGITTSLAGISGYEKSAGFAVPLDESVRRIVDSLLKGEEVEYGFLGVVFPRPPSNLTPDELRIIAEQFRQPGAVRINKVLPNSAAINGGLMHEDIILSVNGKPVTSHEDLTREIGLLAPGSLARLHLLRFGMRGDLMRDVIVGKWPVRDDEGIIATKRKYEPWRGVVVDFSSARNRYIPMEFGQPSIPNGVLVTEVEPGSPAAAAELQAGDFIAVVNRAPVGSPQRFLELTQPLKGDVNLTVSSGSGPSRTVTLKAP